MKHGFLKTVGIVVLAFALAACGQTSAPAAIQVPTEEPVVVLPTTQPVEPCANPNFPVKNNAVYNYSSTGSALGPYSFSRTISNVRPDAFTITTFFDNMQFPQEWQCTPEGLLAMQLGATDFATMTALKRFSNLTVTNLTGVSLPSSLTPGQQWQHAFEIQGTENPRKPGATPAAMTGKFSATYTAGNTEKVNVPAGSFDAVAIQAETLITFTMNNNGTTYKYKVINTYTFWYAPGVGWVKASGNGRAGGQPYFETIVLESYTIQ